MHEKEFMKYEPFTTDLRLDWRFATFGIAILNVRRLVALLMAMFVLHRPWLQLLVFIAFNFISLTFATVVRPYESD